MPTEFILSVLMPKMANKSNRIWKFILNAMMLMFCFGDFAKADTTAVTTLPGSSFPGFINGAVGFSFTPVTNIVVTQVGYRDDNVVMPIIKFWSDTNYVFASYNLPPGSNSHQVVYTNVSLTLFAGQRYSITVQDGISTINVAGTLDFQVASELSDFVSRVFQTNSITDQGTNVYIQGPDFTFTNFPGSISAPDLTIARESATNVIVSWPAASPGFILQQIDALDSTNWLSDSNAISIVNGTNQISDFTISNRFYRLYHP